MDDVTLGTGAISGAHPDDVCARQSLGWRAAGSPLRGCLVFFMRLGDSRRVVVAIRVKERT